MSRSSRGEVTLLKISLEDRTPGNIEPGTPNRFSRSRSNVLVWMLKSIVREALLASVT